MPLFVPASHLSYTKQGSRCWPGVGETWTAGGLGSAHVGGSLALRDVAGG